MLRNCGLCLAAGAVVWFAGPPVALPAVPMPVDRLLVVDCLLPGQVRKLGGAMTYLSPRRPVKVVASECEIRGGEYVAYDRANFSTSLQVWKPQAEQGDPQAQTYVGEIFEKGLGTSPDFAQAAAWYQKAADQGYSRGLSNLAYLYEQGLGVPKDPVKALNLYRKSAGISTDDLTFASEVTAAKAEAATQISALTEQLAKSNEEAESLRADLEHANAEALSRRHALAVAQHEADALRTQVKALQDGSNAGSQERVAELKRMEADLATREAQISQQQREAQALEAVAKSRSQELTQRLQRAADEGSQLRAQLGRHADDSQQARAELAASQARMESMNAQIAQLQSQLNSERAALAEQRAQISKRASTPAGAKSDEMNRLRQELAEREARLAQQQSLLASAQTQRGSVEKEVERLKTQLATAEQQQEKQATDNEALRAQLASTQQRLLLSQQKLKDANATVEAERTRVALEREQLQRRRDDTSTQQQAEIRRLTQELGEREAKLIEQRSTMAAYEAESHSYMDEVSRLKSEQTQRVAMRSAEAPALPAATASPASAPVASPRELDLGGYYALIIGNNNYQNMPNLDSAVNDAHGIERVLKGHYGFKTRLLLNATRADILGALNEYRQSLGERDSLLIYYAGHGELDERNLRGYWLPVNAKRDDTTEWISDRMITDQIGLMAARHVLVIADSCYSGAMTRSSGLRLVAVAGQSAEMKRLVKLAKLPSRTVLTSGGAAPVLDGGAGSNSIFARALIDSLSRNQSILEASALYNQVFDPVRRAAARFKVEQSPRYSVLADAGHLNGEFLLIPTI